MASLNGTFDATQVTPQEAFSVIPAGKYKVQIVASEMRPTKDGNGQYIWLEMEILDGQQQGRKLWDRLNIINQNQQAVDIAQRALSAICHSVGKLHVSDTEELHLTPMVVTVRVKAASGNYDASNEIRGYEPANGAAQMTFVPQQATAQAPMQQATPPGASRPWAQARRTA